MKIELKDVIEFMGTSKEQVLGTERTTAVWNENEQVSDFMLSLLSQESCEACPDSKTLIKLVDKLQEAYLNLVSAHETQVAILEHRVAYLLQSEKEEKLHYGTNLTPTQIEAYLRRRKLKTLASL